MLLRSFAVVHNVGLDINYLFSAVFTCLSGKRL